MSPSGSSNDTSKTKVRVKDILKSHNRGNYTAFPPISRFADRRSSHVPFNLTQTTLPFGKANGSNALSNAMPEFILKNKQKQQQRSLPSFRASSSTRADSDESDGEEVAGRRRTRKRTRVKAALDSSDDEEQEEEEEEEENDDGMLYVDENERQDRLKDTLTSMSDRAIILQKLFPKSSPKSIQEALEKAGGSHVKACQILSGMKSTAPAPPPPPSPVAQRTFKRLRQRRKEYASESDDSEDERRSPAMNHRAQIEEARKMLKALRFYNNCTTQDIQDVCGCGLDQAQKLIDKRPFNDIDDLRETLQQERGLSLRFIQNYLDMVDGYSLVDQIIEEIEELGGKLKNAIDIWKGAAEKDDEEDAGVHLTSVNAVNKDQSSEAYRDAMEGFLTEQPKIINPDFTLKDYQILGINWLLLLYRKGISGILADEMGLGKTAQVISFLGRLYELGNKGPHLIIVPTSTLDNWLREFERFCPDMDVVGYYGTQSEREDMRIDLLEELDCQVIVTTYNIATGSKEDRGFLRKLKCKSMILDEGHMVRNCTSQRYKHLISLKTPFRLLLTGTPLQNNLQELVSLLMFIMPDILIEYEEEIRKIFKIKVSANKDSSAQILSQQRIKRAKKMMTPFVLRRRKADVLKDLPQKMQVIERCKMSKNQQELYDTILSESRQSYKEAMDTQTKKAKGATDGLERFKNIVIQLRKAADHPLLFRTIYKDATLKKMAKTIMKEEQYMDANQDYIYEDMTVMSDFELDKLCKNHKSISSFALKNNEWMDSGKVEKLKELLPAMKSKGNKVLLFSQFTRLLDILELVMDTLNIKYLRLDGETKLADRQILIDQFNEDKSIDVFLLSTKAGGFGINLTSANVVVLYDLDFNPQNDRQAEDRAHRKVFQPLLLLFFCLNMLTSIYVEQA
ncbi:hypothetical protein BX666DRAFT_347644 [Dichotomocladium elegans]|nr:hypothetical protein BX666DRAFT_347644 [Dichotomocladium elegans]